MKNYLAIISLMFCLVGLSQTQSVNAQQTDRSVAIGLKGGTNIPRMLYFQNEALSQLDQRLAFTPMGGLFVEIPIGDSWVFAPEVVYLQRGTVISFTHFSGVQVHYSMNASYADLRLPFELCWLVSRAFQPYLMVGAEAGMRLFGQIHIDRSEPFSLNQTIDVGDANLNFIHAGAFAGLGLRSRFDIGRLGVVVKLSAAIHQGLLDSYSVKEKEGAAQSVNVNAYQVTGNRLPQGLEVTLGVAIPLELQAEDACATFSRDRYRRHRSGRHLFGY